jgi:hypothetical protein
MAKPPRGPADPRYGGPDYDPVYGPAFDSQLGEPVSPPLLPRTPPRDNRKLGLVAGAIVAGIAVLATGTVFAVRALTPDPVVTRPGPPVQTGPAGQLRTVVDDLTARGYSCSPQYVLTITSRYGCFATRADTVLASAVLETDDADEIDAVRLTVRELSRNPALFARNRETLTELAAVVGATAFPADRTAVDAAVAKAGPKKIVKGAWGNYRVSVNAGDTAVLFADRTGHPARTAPSPAIGTPRKVLTGELSNAGWLCAATCTKREKVAVSALTLGGAGDTVTGLRLRVTAPTVGPVEQTRTAFHQQVTSVLGMLDGDGLDDVGGWLSEQRSRGSGSAYVHGWRVTVEAVYAADRPAGYQLRVDPEPALPALNS